MWLEGDGGKRLFATAAAGATAAVQGASNLGKNLGNLRSADSGSSGSGSSSGAAKPESIEIEGLNTPWEGADRDTIEAELGGNLPDRFPYIDVWDAESGTATSVKSLDWRRDTYRFSHSAITSTGKKYVQDMVNFSKNGASWDGVTVTPDMVKSNEPKLAFPAGPPIARSPPTRRWSPVVSRMESRSSCKRWVGEICGR